MTFEQYVKLGESPVWQLLVKAKTAVFELQEELKKQGIEWLYAFTARENLQRIENVLRQRYRDESEAKKDSSNVRQK